MLINLNCPLSTFTSYGLTGLNLLEALCKLGHDVNAFKIGPVSYYEYQTHVEQCLKNAELTIPFSTNANHGFRGLDFSPSIRLFHQFDLRERIGNGKHIGFPIFELDNFSLQEQASLQFCDELIVCSKWAKDVIHNSFNPYVKCSVVPLGVDREIFYDSELIKEDNEREKPFTLIYPAKLEKRKELDICMDVFDKAFSTENVQVLFLPQNLFIKDNEDWAKSLMNSNLGKKGRVRILDRLEHPQQVANLIRYSDAVVSFSRAEGWNLPLLEALSCGREVLATYYSGHTEFLTEENATLLEVNGRELAIDGVFFKGDGSWLSYTESDIDDLVSYLRMMFRRGRKFNQAGVETAKKFTWENSARKLVECL